MADDQRMRADHWLRSVICVSFSAFTPLVIGAAEGHLKWDGKNGDVGAVPQWGPGAKPLVAGMGRDEPPQKLTIVFL